MSVTNNVDRDNKSIHAGSEAKIPFWNGRRVKIAAAVGVAALVTIAVAALLFVPGSPLAFAGAFLTGATLCKIGCSTGLAIGIAASLMVAIPSALAFFIASKKWKEGEGIHPRADGYAAQFSGQGQVSAAQYLGPFVMRTVSRWCPAENKMKPFVIPRGDFSGTIDPNNLNEVFDYLTKNPSLDKNSDPIQLMEHIQKRSQFESQYPKYKEFFPLLYLLTTSGLGLGDDDHQDDISGRLLTTYPAILRMLTGDELSLLREIFQVLSDPRLNEIPQAINGHIIELGSVLNSTKLFKVFAQELDHDLKEKIIEHYCRYHSFARLQLTDQENNALVRHNIDLNELVAKMETLKKHCSIL